MEAVASTDGLDCWYPCAPGMAENWEGMTNRVEGSCPHHPAYLYNSKIRLDQLGGWEVLEGGSLLRLFIGPLFVDVDTGDTPRPGIEVFIRAPDGEIDIPVM